MVERLDCVVVGAGVVGLAIGRSLALAGREVVVLEAEPEIGVHSSSRNSEVIHAGIYYGDDTLKARLCVQGNAMLYRYCEERHIPCKRIGKLIVAPHESEVDKLNAIRRQAATNGVTDLQELDAPSIRKLEPEVACKAALLSPSTGIIDSHSLLMSLRADIEANHGTVLTHSRVVNVKIVSGEFSLAVDDSKERFNCNTLVNSAGLFAADFARSIKGLDRNTVGDLRLVKGHYFAYQGKSPFNHLIYPLPVDGGLGVHATNDMRGHARFGPDVDWVESINYSFDESRVELIADAIKKYFPNLDKSRLAPAYTGIRPKLCGPGDAAADFLIQGEAVHGVGRLVNLFGIESPGLTSCLAIGNYVNDMLS